MVRGILFFLIIFTCGCGQSEKLSQGNVGLPLPKALSGLDTDISAYVILSLDTSKHYPLSYNATSGFYEGTTASVPKGSTFDLTIVYSATDPISNKGMQIAHYIRPNILAADDVTKVNYEGDEANWQAVFNLVAGQANALDLDGDGFSNFAEIGYKTNPQLNTSFPEGPKASASLQNPLSADQNISVQPDAAQTSTPFTGAVDIIFTAASPFSLKSFDVIDPPYGAVRLTPLSTALSDRRMVVRLHTELFVVDAKAVIEISVKAIDAVGVEKITKFYISAQNGADIDPPTRLDLGISDGQVLNNENLSFNWELGDASGIDPNSISVQVDSAANQVHLDFAPADQDEEIKHYKGTVIFNATDYPNGSYTFTFKATDSGGRAYSEVVTLEVNNTTTQTQSGANPKVKFNGKIIQGGVPEANALGVPSKVILDGSLSTAPSNASIAYLWSCIAPGFSFISSKISPEMELPNLSRSQDGYTISCNLTITQGTFTSSRNVGVIVVFVDQKPTINNFSLTPVSGTILTPKNFKLSWAVSDPDGSEDIKDYDLNITRKKYDGSDQSVISCQGIPAGMTTLVAGQDLVQYCTLQAMDHGELATPAFHLGANHDYDFTLSVYDLSDVTGEASMNGSIQDEELKARYRFENNVADNSGYNGNGTYYNNNTPSAAVFSDSGNSVMKKVLKFNKVQKQQVRIANQFSITGGDFTLSAWIKTNGLGFPQAILEARNGTTGFEFYIDQNERFSFYSAHCAAQLSSVKIKPNIWQQLLVTRKNGKIQLYLNAELVGSSTCMENLANQSQLTMGCNSPDIVCSEPFEGEMDEVLMYNRALDVDEVRRLCRANDPDGKVCPSDRTPIILEPAAGAVLMPTRAFWSWRGERDVAGSLLHPSDVFEVKLDGHATHIVDSAGYHFPNLPVVSGGIHKTGHVYSWVEDRPEYLNHGYLARVRIAPVENEGRLSDFEASRHYSYAPQMSAWYPFQDGGGVKTANDLSDSSNTGPSSNINLLDNWNNGWADLGYSLKLNGINNRFDVLDAPILDFGTGDFSVGAYVNTVAEGTTQTIIEKFDVIGGFELFKTINNELVFNINDCSSKKGALNLNVWQHVTGTRRMISVNKVLTGIVTIYIDGEPMIQNYCQATEKILKVSNMNLLAIGHDSRSGYYFNGYMDEVFLHNIQYSGPAIKNQFCALKTLTKEWPASCLE